MKTWIIFGIILFLIPVIENANAISNQTILINPNFTTSAGGAGNAWSNTTKGTCDTTTLSRWEPGTKILNITCLGRNDPFDSIWTTAFVVNSSMINPTSVTLDFNHSFTHCTTTCNKNYNITLTYPNGTKAVLFSNLTGASPYSIYTHLTIGANNFTAEGIYNITLGNQAGVPNTAGSRNVFYWDDVQFSYTYPSTTGQDVTLLLSMGQGTQKISSFKRNPTNIFDLSDARVPWQHLTRSTTNTLTLATSGIRSQKILTSVTQNILSTQAILGISSRIRGIVNSIDLSEAIARLTSFTRSLDNAIDLTDVISRLTSFTRSLTNSLNLSNLAERIRSIPRSITNAFNITDTLSRLTSLIRSLTNTFSLTSIVERTTTTPVIQKTATLAFTLTDNIQKLLTNVRLTTNAIQITELPGRILSLGKIIQNAFSLNEISARIASVGRLVTNTFSITDAIERFRIIPRLITQTLNISELLSRLLSFQRITSLQILVTPTASPSLKTISSTFTMPITSVSQGKFVEFDINVRNTGTETINASTGVEVYNSTNYLISTINSTNVTISSGSSKTIITFLNTINLSADNYRAEGRVFFDGRATINMTKLFNITSATATQIGNYTNTSINFTTATPTLIIINTSSSTRINASILLNSTQEGAIAIAEFSSVPNQTITSKTSLGKFVDITSSTNITNNLMWYWLNISYTDAEVLSSGVTESGLRIWFYNTTTSSWQQESNSGVDTSANYVWANVSHLSLFGIYSPVAEQPAAPSASSAPSGGGGGGAISPIPTINIEFVKWSVLRVVSGQSIVESVLVKNKGIESLTDLDVKVSGVPSDWVSLIPKNIDLPSGQSKAINLAISVPKGVTPGDYKLLITLKNSKVEDSNFMIVRVKDYAPTYDRPIVTRIVQLDYDANKTKVTLDVTNPVKYYNLVEVQEEIPKSLAQSSRDVEFDPYPDEIIREDPLVQWNINEFVINDTRTLSYLTKGILDEFAGYIYFPLKELNIIETKLPTGLKFVDISIEPLFAGKASVGKINIENIGDETKKLEFSMYLPPGWKMIPEKIEDNITAHKGKEFKFSIVVPENTSVGDYIGTSIIVWDKDTYIKEVVLHVSSVPSYTIILLTIGVIIGAVATWFVYKSRKKREHPLVYRFRGVVSKIKQKE